MTVISTSPIRTKTFARRPGCRSRNLGQAAGPSLRDRRREGARVPERRACVATVTGIRPAVVSSFGDDAATIPRYAPGDHARRPERSV